MFIHVGTSDIEEEGGRRRRRPGCAFHPSVNHQNPTHPTQSSKHSKNKPVFWARKATRVSKREEARTSIPRGKAPTIVSMAASNQEDVNNLMDLRSRNASPIDNFQSGQQAPVDGAFPVPQSHIQQIFISESEGGAGHSDEDPHAREITANTRTSYAALVLEKIGNLNRASYATTADLLEEFFNLRLHLRATTKPDDTMLALWLLNAVKSTHPSLYGKHMTDLKPPPEAVLSDLNKLQEAEKADPRLAKARKYADQTKEERSDGNPESFGRSSEKHTCVWCQKKHGGRVCFWVFPEALPDDWYGRDRFLRNINAWLATDKGRTARERALNRRRGATGSNGKKDVVTRDDICWSTSNEHTIFNDLKWFFDIDMVDEGTVTGLGGYKGKGTVRFNVVDPGDPSKRVSWTQRDVRYDPFFPVNSLSAGHCREHGYEYDWNKCAIVKVDTGISAASIVWKNKRPFLDTPSVELSVTQAPCF